MGQFLQRFFSVFAMLLVATVGAFAGDVCGCPDSSGPVGPADRGCSCPEGCWCRPVSLADAPVAGVLAQGQVEQVRDVFSGGFTFLESSAARNLGCLIPSTSVVVSLRPPPLRAGSLCLRI